MVFLDLETFSELDLKTVALDRYSAHPSTRILMCAYAIDDGPMQLWQEGEDKTELQLLITSSVCVAWNVSFERSVLARVWGIRAPRQMDSGWVDAMVLARYAGLPASLKDCNRVPYFKAEAVTNKESRLIAMFCNPQKDGSIRNAQTDPEDWAAFCDYCQRDVKDTRLIYKWLLNHFDMPDRVYKLWQLDQEINKRGMPIDLALCYAAKQEADRLQVLAHEQLTTLTGLDNANSSTQLLKWVSERGYPYAGLAKELVTKAIEVLPDGECKTALQLRLAGAKASIKKLPKIMATVGNGSRLRDQYRFYGAHTGRWAGRGAQLQNLKAPRTKEEKQKVALVIAALEAGRQVESLDDLSLSLRPIITAPRGKKVVLADFKSVENRVLAWLSGCEPMMQGYADGRDPYIDFAARMEDIPYEEVTAELRQIVKPGVLGCGFGLGGGQLIRMAKCPAPCKNVWNVGLEDETAKCKECGRVVKTGQVQKTGLWRYAEMMGVELSKEQASKQVGEFRTTFMDVCNFWIALENCFAACAQTKRNQHITSSLGPTIRMVYRDPALRIVMPSGEEMNYCNPYASWGYNQQGFKTLTLGFDGVRGNSWGRQHTYGGRLCENAVQKVAGILLGDALIRTEKDKDLEIVGHTHDEIITLADAKDTGAVKRLEGYMGEVEPWAAGLVMAADGYEGKRYAKG